MNILITGGASGLGESITRKLLTDPNNRVYFTYNQSADSAKKIESEFANATAISCDFKSEKDVALLEERIAELDLDVLINNAYTGSFIKTYFHKIPPADFLTEFKQNVMPTVILTQAAIHSFRKKKNGKIITILTSALTGTAPIGTAVYIANKAYLSKLSKIWALENAKYQITSVTVSPSFMLTDFTRDLDDRIVEQIRDSSPHNKLLTTGEVAETVSYLTHTSDPVNGIDMAFNTGTDV